MFGLAPIRKGRKVNGCPNGTSCLIYPGQRAKISENLVRKRDGFWRHDLVRSKISEFGNPKSRPSGKMVHPDRWTYLFSAALTTPWTLVAFQLLELTWLVVAELTRMLPFCPWLDLRVI
jgi:hypothetical protein